MSKSSNSKKSTSAGQLTIKLVRSKIAALPKHKATLKGLGLSKIGQQVVREDTACMRGMVAKVAHLLEVK
jgi:large subunit ribosomal protein L30